MIPFMFGSNKVKIIVLGVRVVIVSRNSDEKSFVPRFCGTVKT